MRIIALCTYLLRFIRVRKEERKKKEHFQIDSRRRLLSKASHNVNETRISKSTFPVEFLLFVIFF